MTTSWTTPAVSAGFDAYDDYVETRLAYTPLVNDLRTTCGREAIVLDYGCGSGKVSRRLLDAEAAAQVVGVDISTDMITLAQVQSPQPAARFHTIDSGHVPYPDDTFDAVVCCFVFINVPTREELRAIARELARVLTPTGTLFIVDSNPAATGIPFPTFRSGEPGRCYRDGDERRVSLQIPGTGVLELVDRHWFISTYEAVLNEAGFTVDQVTDRGAQSVEDVGMQSPIDHPPFMQITAHLAAASESAIGAGQMTCRRSYPKPATLAAVVWEGRVLLIRRAHMPDAGRWAFPGGKIELGETLTVATVRELAEETGVHATPGDVFDAVDVIDADHDLHYVLIAVLCRWERGELVSGDDALEAAWFTLEDMDAIPVAQTFDVRAIAETALELEREQQERPK